MVLPASIEDTVKHFSKNNEFLALANKALEDLRFQISCFQIFQEYNSEEQQITQSIAKLLEIQLLALTDCINDAIVDNNLRQNFLKKKLIEDIQNLSK